MPLYVKMPDGSTVKVGKAAEAGGPQTIAAVLEAAGTLSFTEAAAELLGAHRDAYDGAASGKDGTVLKSDAEAWLAARNGQEE